MTYLAWGRAGHLTTWLFEQDKLWITAKSEAKQIADMTPQHALNTLLMLERMDDLPYRGESLHATPLYGALKDRVVSFLPPEAGALNLGPPEHPADAWHRENVGTGSILDTPIFMQKPVEASFTIEFPRATFRAPEAGPAEPTDKVIDAYDTAGIIRIIEAALAREKAENCGQVVTIKYKDASGAVTLRDVYPTEITMQPGRFGFTEKRMLKAYDTLRDEPRTFRLDRIEWAQGTVREA